MTNHVHLLATPTASNAVSLMMQSLGRQYVRYYNHTYKRTGSCGKADINHALFKRANIYSIATATLN